MSQSTPYILTDRAGALANYPHARRVGDLIFVSGISSRRPDNTHEGVVIERDDRGEVVRVHKDIEAQTTAVIENIAAILERAGACLSDVVDCAAFLVDMDDYPGFNRAYNRFFDAQSGPTRTTVAVHQLPHPNLLVELKVIAYAPLTTKEHV
ncbi:MAG TPA: 2-aminomuconate deaminase [Myxococcales bacterium]|nr:2-aminomuconate deaminase [Myxococcales bacterium]